MNPGTLDTLVTIKRATETRQANGSVSVSWADVSPSVWARFEPLTGRELIVAQKIERVVTTKATIRAGSGVTPEDRIADGSIIYEIANMPRIGTRDAWQELWLTEVKA